MTIFDALILGIVEGVTEFLPVSSTGHLILASAALGIPESDFLKSFEVAIQLGAIAAVVALYAHSFLEMETLKRLALAFLPTALAGFLLYKTVKNYFLGNELLVVASLFLGGIALIVFEFLHREEENAPRSISDMSYLQSFLVGCFQAIAIVPGVSRSAATILGGLLLGVSRVAIVEFSFLLAVPTMLSATVFDIARNAQVFNAGNLPVLAVGFATSFVVAMFAIRLLLSYVRNHSFIPFGVYRIALALVFLLFFL